MRLLESVGRYWYLVYRVFGSISFRRTHRRRVFTQMDESGVHSIPLILLVGFFAGAIIAWQAAYQFRGMISLSVMGGQVTRVIVMEMGPVLTALVISGRIGASMTAEIGTMKVTEQIDALRTMALDPVQYIVYPRVAALTIMLPVLTIFSNLVGIFGAYVVSGYFLDITHQVFLDSIRTFFDLQDLTGGLIKSAFFGLIISMTGCFMGLSASGGARGVGRATISSFVLSAVFILIGDFFLWLILF